MGIRKICFDESEEQLLADLEKETCLPISRVIKKAIAAFAASSPGKLAETPAEFFSRIDLGPGGCSAGQSDRVKEVVREQIRKKLKR